MENTVDPLILVVKLVMLVERITIRNSNGIQLSIMAIRSPTAFFLLNHVKRGSPRQSRMANDARLFHSGKFSFGNSQLVRVQAVGLGKNQQARLSEKMVADRMTRW